MTSSRRSNRAATAVSLLAAAGMIGWMAAGSRRRYPVHGKVVLITGGSRGLGLALAETFGRAGARLVLTARDEQELRRAQALLVERGAAPTAEHVTLLPCDLRDAAAVDAMVATATLLLGRIDVVINNAGVIVVGPVENQPLAAYRESMESNYFGMVHTTLAVLPQMLSRSRTEGRDPGAIVNITSIGGKVAVPHLLPYSASKFAAVGFSQGLHAELASKGVRVTTVCPGLMRTGSPGKALVVGDREREFRWFHLGASLPLVASSAGHAARRILRAVECGEGELAITPQAAVAARLAQVAPAVTAGVLSLVNSALLPAPVAGSQQPQAGSETDGRALRPLTVAGDKAAVRWNQVAGAIPGAGGSEAG
ncbi:MAG TPA: SDR family NAD(P)-dependent oxidoreductase [Acidobacteriaceae bacterium]